jgi:hypothetical protein
MKQGYFILVWSCPICGDRLINEDEEEEEEEDKFG